MTGAPVVSMMKLWRVTFVCPAVRVSPPEWRIWLTAVSRSMAPPVTGKLTVPLCSLVGPTVPGVTSRLPSAEKKAAGKRYSSVTTFDRFSLLCRCNVGGNQHGQSHDGSRKG